MTESSPSDRPAPPPESKWRTIALVALPLLGIALVALAITLVRPREPGRVTAVYSQDQAEGAAVNIGAVHDATDPSALIVPRRGYRYKLFIDEESEDRTSGIARMGGRITFIPGARRGQTILADVTRIRERVIDAVLVRVLSEVALPRPAAPAAYTPPPGDSTAHVVAGAEMDVVISQESTQNPGKEGIARVEGLIVVVDGATDIGSRVNIRITDRRERIAFAELTGQPAGTEPLPTFTRPAPTMRPDRRAYQPRAGDPAAHVVAGAEMDVVITEESGQSPGVDGVARVNGLVVFVQGAPTLGETVHVRITDRRERAANAVPTGKPAGTAAAPSAGEVVRRALPQAATRGAADHVVAGAEIELTITERSRQNPETEGVARVDGLVVFVEGATTLGETVRARVTARRERVAFAEVIRP